METANSFELYCSATITLGAGAKSIERAAKHLHFVACKSDGHSVATWPAKIMGLGRVSVLSGRAGHMVSVLKNEYGVDPSGPSVFGN